MREGYRCQRSPYCLSDPTPQGGLLCRSRRELWARKPQRFDFNSFYSEVGRVAKAGSALVAWAYELAMVSPQIDRVLDEFYNGSIHSYWPDERRHIESGYTTIPFPFRPIAVPSFVMTQSWTVDQMLSYLRTWSAVKRFFRTRGEDPVDAIEQPLRKTWGAETRKVVWPLKFLAGRIEG